MNSYGASLAYRHFWSEGFRSTLMLSSTQADVPAGSGLSESSQSVHLNNNRSSGSSALYLARQAVQSGAVECALAFGFEEMQPGALGSHRPGGHLG